MTLTEAIEIVERHQQRRRGAEIEMSEPEALGQAIDIVLNAAKRTSEHVRDLVPLPPPVVYEGKPEPEITVTFHEAPDGSKPKTINTKKKPNDKRTN